MATTLAFFRPTSVPGSAHSHHKPDPKARKPVSSSWWATLFGLSSDPDYTNPAVDSTRDTSDGPGLVPIRSRFAPGCFTEQKARKLRRKTVETSTFHDVMYHSAIASRLASDVSKLPEKWDPPEIR